MSGWDFGMSRGYSGAQEANYRLGLAALEQYNKTSNQKDNSTPSQSQNLGSTSGKPVSF